MSSKANAIQVMVALGFTAVAYTVYNAASNKDIKVNMTPIQAKSVMILDKNDKAANTLRPVQDQPAVYTPMAVPGYCNPEDGSK